MRAPLWLVYGNCVYGAGPDDGWAAFCVQTSSYSCLSEEEKRARFLDLLGALETVEADIQLLRVSRRVEVAPTASAPGSRMQQTMLAITA